MVERLKQSVRRSPVRAIPFRTRSEDGQGLVEYGLITGLVAVAVLVVASVGGVGSAVLNMYDSFPGVF